MGQDGVDTDLPTRIELLCLNNVLGKVFFAWVLFIIALSSISQHDPVAHSRSFSMPSGQHSFALNASHAGTC